MATYEVEGIDSRGKSIKGRIEANSSQDAIVKLKVKGVRPINIKEVVTSNKSQSIAQQPAEGQKKPVTKPGYVSKVPPMAPSPVKRSRGVRITLFEKVSHKQLTQFTGQFYILQNAGLPVVRSLKILGSQMKPCLLKDNVLEISDDVETGSSLSDALSRHPKVFDKLYISMIRAGEAGGILDTCLQRLAVFMEKAEAIKRKLVSASVYPAVVITVAFGVVFVLMKFIVPKFKEIFEKVNVALPGLTKMLIGISNFVSTYWYFIVAFPIALIIALKIFANTKSGRYMIDNLKLNMPAFGELFRKAATARFARTLGTLLQSGVPILDALTIVRNTIGNEVVARAVGDVRDSIKEGENVAGPLAQSHVFDDMVINMIQVGEETGELDKMLGKIADTYDAEVDAAISGLMSILEPMLILFLGVVVGFIVVSLFLPLVTLIEKIGKTG